MRIFEHAAVLLATVLASAEAMTVERVIRLTPITQELVPTDVLQGDREFNGNGPLVRVGVRLRILEDRTGIVADVSLSAKETTHDWSTTEGRWSVPVWRACPGQLRPAPAGRRDRTILDAPVSSAQVLSESAGRRPGPDRVYRVPPLGGRGPVEAFSIVGDTVGDDISTDADGRGDTRIVQITFKALRVELLGNPDCIADRPPIVVRPPPPR